MTDDIEHEKSRMGWKDLRLRNVETINLNWIHGIGTCLTSGRQAKSQLTAEAMKQKLDRKCLRLNPIKLRLATAERKQQPSNCSLKNLVSKVVLKTVPYLLA